MDWKTWESITEVIVNVSIIAGAIVAMLKFKIYKLFSLRFKSEVDCSHHLLSSGKVLFIGNYIIHNTGERPFTISSVEITLFGALEQDGLLSPDVERVLAKKTFSVEGEVLAKGVFQLEAGERSIFPLRTELDELDDVVFLVCKFGWRYRRDPSAYIWLYAKNATRTPYRYFSYVKPTDAL